MLAPTHCVRRKAWSLRRAVTLLCQRSNQVQADRQKKQAKQAQPPPLRAAQGRAGEGALRSNPTDQAPPASRLKPLLQKRASHAAATSEASFSPLPCATRRGGLGRGALRSKPAAQTFPASRLTPLVKKRASHAAATSEASFSPLPCAKRRGGPGRGALRSSPAPQASQASQPTQLPQNQATSFRTTTNYKQPHSSPG